MPSPSGQCPVGAVIPTDPAGAHVIVCAPSHPLARESTFKLSDIAPCPWIAPPAGSPHYADLKNALLSIGIKDFRVSFTGGSLASIISVMAGSESLTVLPYSVVFMQAHAKTIIALPVKLEHPKRELGILWREDRAARPAVTRFRRFLEAEFTGLLQRIDEKGRNLVWRE